MREPTRPIFHIAHPAPASGTVANWRLIVGIAGAPAAWTLQLSAATARAGNACIAGDGAKRPVVDLDGVGAMIVAANLAALVLALASLALALLAYRQTRKQSSGRHRDILDTAEGRSCFLALWGVGIGTLFTVAIAFNTVSLFWTSLCGL